LTRCSLSGCDRRQIGLEGRAQDFEPPLHSGAEKRRGAMLALRAGWQRWCGSRGCARQRLFRDCHSRQSETRFGSGTCRPLPVEADAGGVPTMSQGLVPRAIGNGRQVPIYNR